MAENRLLRENNPEPGERRGYVPQHLEAGSNEYSKTEGSQGALHTKIVDQHGEPYRQENPVPVQLTGSSVVIDLLEGYETIPSGTSFTLLYKEALINGVDTSLFKKASFLWDIAESKSSDFYNVTTRLRASEIGTGRITTELYNYEVLNGDLSSSNGPKLYEKQHAFIYIPPKNVNGRRLQISFENRDPEEDITLRSFYLHLFN